MLNAVFDFVRLGNVSLIVVTISALLSGCESLRLHDEGRLKAAESATTAATKLNEQSGNVFELMEANLDKVRVTQAELRDRSNQHEYETFKVIAADLTVDEIADQLIEVMDRRNQIFQAFSALESEAVQAVNQQLDRQALITKVLNEKKRATDLNGTLERIDARLKWIDTALERFEQVQQGVDPEAAGPGTDVPGRLSELGEDAATNAQVIRTLVGDAQKAINRVDQDEQVQAARKLLNAMVLETTTSEQMRLSELQRYLKEVRRLRDLLAVRDRISVCELYTVAFTHTYPASSQEHRADFEKLWESLRISGRYSGDEDGSCLDPLSTFADDDQVKQTWRTVQERWHNGSARLAEYAAASFKSDEKSAPIPQSTAEFIGAISILLFHEREKYELALLDLAREKHRHSVRLSAHNAGQRAQLVHQLTQGLKIYYEGGVKPEEIAQLMLLAAQSGGIFYIGSQL
jgi:hypothetical protein